MLVEDDRALRAALVSTLRTHGFAAIQCASAEEAIVQLDLTPAELVLLDLALPGADGLELLRRIRSFSPVPVIVLTVRDDKATKLAALDGGADDYVTKPFDSGRADRTDPRRAAPAPGRAPPGPVVQFSDLEVDRVRGVVTRAGEEVRLTATEWRLLELLIRSEGRLLTYEMLSSELRGGSSDLDAKALRVYVGHLRRKLGDDAADPTLILTHFGLGVRWIAGQGGDD